MTGPERFKTRHELPQRVKPRRVVELCRQLQIHTRAEPFSVPRTYVRLVLVSSPRSYHLAKFEKLASFPKRPKLIHAREVAYE